MKTRLNAVKKQNVLTTTTTSTTTTTYTNVRPSRCTAGKNSKNEETTRKPSDQEAN